jgi:TolB protein
MEYRGDRIAFSRWEPGEGEWLFTMRADGSDVKQLTTTGQGHSYCACWSPDGSRLCFASRRDGYSSLYLIAADGSDELRLTAAGDVDDDYPAWSPDGRTIAFSRGNSGGAEDLWLVNVESGEQRPLTASGHLDYRPSWSPNGAHIAFRRSLAKRAGVYVMRLGGGEPWYVTRGHDPSWSPTGDRLACSHGESLWAVPVDVEGHPVGDPAQLTLHPRAVDRYPSWSPDGMHLAFEREEVRERYTTCRIMIVAADGRDLRDLGAGRMPQWGPIA